MGLKYAPDVIQEKGTFVKIRYSLKTGEGSYIKGDPREGLAFMEIFTGYDQLIPGLEKRLVGKKVKEKMHVCLPPEEAFGPVRSDLVKEKTYDEFPEGRDLQEGRWVLARDEKTRAAIGYFVQTKGKDGVVLDYNHPLAGKELVYDLEILEVRPATSEEKSILRPCEGDPEEV